MLDWVREGGGRKIDTSGANTDSDRVCPGVYLTQESNIKSQMSLALALGCHYFFVGHGPISVTECVMETDFATLYHLVESSFK